MSKVKSSETTPARKAMIKALKLTLESEEV